MSDLVSALSSRIGSGGGSLPAPVVLNPLGAYQGALQTAGSVYDLRQKQSVEALGQVYQQSIDPATGRFDPLRFNTLLSQRPAAAMSAQSGVESGQKLQGQQFTLSDAQNSALNGAITSTLKLPDDQLKPAVLQQTQRLIDAGVIPRDRGMASLLNLSSDPATLRQQLETLRIQTLPPQAQQTAIYGTPGTQTGPGGQTIGFTVDPTTGNIRVGQGGAPQGLGPEGLNTLVTVPDLRKKLPDGTPNQDYLKPRQMPLGEFLGIPGSRPGAAPDLGTGRPPAALVNPKGPQPPQPGGDGQAAPAQPPYKQPTAPSPGEAKEADLAGPQFQSESTRGQEAVQQQAALGTMLSDLNQFTSGSGAGKTLDWKRAIVSWAPRLAGVLRVDPKDVASQESFDKLAAQVVQAQNPGSDSRMNLNMAATPHSSLSPEGVDYIIRTLQGNADYLQARAALARTYGNRSDYNGFVGSIQNLDPRVFQLERMTKDQRTDYLQSLDAGTKNTILQSAKLVAGLRKDGKI